MFKNLLAFLPLMLLSACGNYGDCIYPENIASVTYKAVVKADEYDWKYVDLKVGKDEKLKVDILNHDVDRCRAYKTILLRGDRANHVILNLEQDDTVTFEPIPALKEAVLKDCNNPPKGIKVHDVDKCKNGFTINIDGKQTEIAPYEGQIFTVIAGDDVTDSKSNLWDQNPSTGVRWIPNIPLVSIPEIYDTDNGLPPLPVAIKNEIDRAPLLTQRKQWTEDFYCGRGKYNSRSPDDRISSYTLNKLCNDKCSYNKYSGDCVYSVDSVPTKTKIVNGVEIETESEKYFSLLKGKIGGAQDIPGSAPDHAEFIYSAPPYSSSNRTMKCIKVGYSYTVQSAGNLELVLNPSGHLHYLRGGYNINIERGCSKASKDSLYMYIGDTPPVMDSAGNFASMTNVFQVGDVNEYRINTDNTATEGKVHFIIKRDSRVDSKPTGNFTINITKPRTFDRTISPIIEGVEDWVTETLYGKKVHGKRIGGVVTRMYNSIVGQSVVKRMIQAMLSLYFALYALFFVMGLIRSPRQEILIMLLKMGVMLQLTASNSWDFFYQYLFTLFVDGTHDLIGLFSNPHEGGTNSHFAFVDNTMSRLLMIETWSQIFGFLFAGPTGWISVMLILWGFWVYFTAIISAVIVYLMCIVMIGLLLSVAPLFIACSLFKYTQKMFTNWIKALTNNMVQPIMIFTGLAFLNQVMNSAVYNLLIIGVCQNCVIAIEIAEGNIGKFCLLSFFLPIGYDPEEDNCAAKKCFESIADSHGTTFPGVPNFFTNVIIFVIVAYLIKKFITFAAEMADSITENFYGGIGSPGGAAHSFEQSVKSVVGQDEDSKNRRTQRRLYEERYKRLMDPVKSDIKLRDSGKDGGGVDLNVKDRNGAPPPPPPPPLPPLGNANAPDGNANAPDGTDSVGGSSDARRLADPSSGDYGSDIGGAYAGMGDGDSDSGGEGGAPEEDEFAHRSGAINDPHFADDGSDNDNDNDNEEAEDGDEDDNDDNADDDNGDDDNADDYAVREVDVGNVDIENEDGNVNSGDNEDDNAGNVDRDGGVNNRNEDEDGKK